MAADPFKLGLFQGILNLAKINLTTEELNKLLLATDNKAIMFTHLGARYCELGVIQGILNLVKKNLTREELNKLLLATDNEGRTFFHVAADSFK